MKKHGPEKAAYDALVDAKSTMGIVTRTLRDGGTYSRQEGSTNYEKIPTDLAGVDRMLQWLERAQLNITDARTELWKLRDAFAAADKAAS